MQKLTKETKKTNYRAFDELKPPKVKQPMRSQKCYQMGGGKIQQKGRLKILEPALG